MKKNESKFMFLSIALLLFFTMGYYIFINRGKFINPNRINNFEACIDAGYAVRESYPRQCSAPDGKIFAEDIGNEFRKWDVIKIANPRPNQEIKSPLTIKGEAKGPWFFEAQFPIKLLDGNKKIIATAVVHAQEDWMTDEFVTFETVLDFEKPSTKKRTLVLEKSNPSGLNQNADQLEVPVVFADDFFEIFDVL